jgi:uncharacterized membrane protein
MNDTTPPDNSNEKARISKSIPAIDKMSIPEELKTILAGLPEEQRTAILGVFISVKRSSSFSGPIPHPDILSGYNDVVKEGAERVLAMAERQSAHRINLEEHVVKEELRQSRRGQTFGFTLGIIGMMISAFMAYTGHETVAAIFGSTTIVGLVTVFVVGRKMQEKDLTEK